MDFCKLEQGQGEEEEEEEEEDEWMWMWMWMFERCKTLWSLERRWREYGMLSTSPKGKKLEKGKKG